jgi:hypothetical protein
VSNGGRGAPATVQPLAMGELHRADRISQQKCHREECGRTYHETSMKQEAAFFEGKEPVLIYIAKTLKDALRLEAALTEAGIDYGVEADEYRGGVIFRSARVGAFFYVLPETVDSAHEAMLRGNFTPQLEQPEKAS